MKDIRKEADREENIEVVLNFVLFILFILALFYLVSL